MHEVNGVDGINLMQLTLAAQLWCAYSMQTLPSPTSRISPNCPRFSSSTLDTLLFYCLLYSRKAGQTLAQGPARRDKAGQTLAQGPARRDIALTCWAVQERTRARREQVLRHILTRATRPSLSLERRDRSEHTATLSPVQQIVGFTVTVPASCSEGTVLAGRDFGPRLCAALCVAPGPSPSGTLHDL
jgi:hypothetical protein